MDVFAIGETVWVKRGTFTSAGVSVRCVDPRVQGNVRVDELATRAMWSGEHSGYTLT